MNSYILIVTLLFLSLLGENIAAGTVVDSGHSDRIGKIVISENSKQLASADYVGKIVVRNVEDGIPIREIRTRSGYMTMRGNITGNDIAFSPDSKLFALGVRSDDDFDGDGSIEIFSTADFRTIIKQKIEVEPGKSPWLEQLKFISNNELVAVTDYRPGLQGEPTLKRSATIYSIKDNKLVRGDDYLILNHYTRDEKFGYITPQIPVPRKAFADDAVACTDGTSGIYADSTGLHTWQAGLNESVLASNFYPIGFEAFSIKCSKNLDVAWIVLMGPNEIDKGIWLRTKILLMWTKSSRDVSKIAEIGLQNISGQAVDLITGDLYLGVGKSLMHFSLARKRFMRSFGTSSGSISKLGYLPAQQLLMVTSAYTHYLGGEVSPQVTVATHSAFNLQTGRQTYSGIDANCPSYGPIVIECEPFNGGYYQRYKAARDLRDLRILPVPGVPDQRQVKLEDVIFWAHDGREVVAESNDSTEKSYDYIVNSAGDRLPLKEELTRTFLVGGLDPNHVISPSLAVGTFADEKNKNIFVGELRTGRKLGSWNVEDHAEDKILEIHEPTKQILVVRQPYTSTEATIFVRDYSGNVIRRLNIRDQRAATFSQGGTAISVVSQGSTTAYLSEISVRSGTTKTVSLEPVGLATSLVETRDGLALGTDEGAVHLLRSGTVFASYFILADGKWFLISSAGHYMSSGDEAAKRIFHEDNTGHRFRVDNFEEKFFRPDLVQLALAGENLIQSTTKISDVKPAPFVEFDPLPASVDTESIPLTVRLKDRGGGFGTYRLLVNGTVIEEKTTGGQAMFRINLRLVPGSNDVRVIAMNEALSMKSTPAQANVIYKPPVLKKPTLWALVVGINTFRNPRYELKYAVADATAIATKLRAGKKEDFFERVVVKLNVDVGTTTKGAILEAFDSFAGISPNDVFVFYMATHGVIEGDSQDSRELYFFTSDVGATAASGLRTAAISQSELKRAIANVPTSKKAIILDACHAGAFGDPLALGARGQNEEAALRILSSATGVIVYSAAASSQQALEGMNGHGLFTSAFLKALDGAADTARRGFVSTVEIGGYVQDTVPKLSQQHFNRDQFPTYYINGQDFPLFKY